MVKKKLGKHLQFYMDCIHKGRIPRSGLCACSWHDLIDEELLMLFKPDGASTWSYWAAGKTVRFYEEFTELRQTIVLFMACLNDEL